MATTKYDEQYEKRLRKLGLAIEELEQQATGEHRDGPRLYAISIKLDADGGSSTLVVLKARMGDERVVGFVGGYRLGDTLLATYEKVRSDLVKWREDRPWGE